MERINGVLRDGAGQGPAPGRLNDLARANEYLARTYLRELDQRFQVEVEPAGVLSGIKVHPEGSRRF